MTEKTCATCRMVRSWDKSPTGLFCEVFRIDAGSDIAKTCYLWHPLVPHLDWVHLCYADGTPIKGAVLPGIAEHGQHHLVRYDNEFGMPGWCMAYTDMDGNWFSSRDGRELRAVVAYAAIPGLTLPEREASND